MDQNKNSYVYFTDELETDKNVHSSSDLTYILNNMPYKMLPYTMNIDFTNNTITKQLPQLTNFSNERVITLEKITSSYNVVIIIFSKNDRY